ncbi:hypothetical protein TSAR_007994, partial [Trichomalopsis sarcophagae]
MEVFIVYRIFLYRSVVGFIQEIIPEKIYTNRVKNEDFRVMKFILNNNDGCKLQCNIYDENIDKFQSQSQLKEKVFLESIRVYGKNRYSKGNADIELTLVHYSSITQLGEFKSDIKVKNITFEDIPSRRGAIKIQSYLKNEFVQKSKNDTTTYFGTTDLTYKLDVLLKKYPEDTLNSELGSKLQLIGELQNDG